MLDEITTLDRKEAIKYGMQLWVITGHKDLSKNTFGCNIRVGIGAETMEEALEEARKRYPTIRFIGVSHQGPIEFVVKK